MTQEHLTGFTLIEISIVLVVIGLTTGGILAGRELIEAAKIRAQIKQVSNFSTATAHFKDKYAALPGDIPQAAATNFGLTFHATSYADTAWSNNGTIDDAGGNAPIRYAGREPYLFSYDLKDANLINFTRRGSSYDVGFYPPVAANPSTGIFISSYRGNIWMYLGKTTYYEGSFLNDHSPGSIGTLTPSQAMSLDTKMDDGIPKSGAVLAVEIPSHLPATSNIAGQCVTDATATSYNVTDNRMWCKLFIRFF